MNAPLINDDNYLHHLAERITRLGQPTLTTDPQTLATLSNHKPGCLPRKRPYGQNPNLIKATDIIDEIPRGMWPALIQAQRGNFLHDHTNQVLPPHDQGQTNYCWAHATVRTAEALRIFEGQPPLILSAESVAVPITNGQNIGGWPEDALKWMIDHGLSRQELWPNNDRSTDLYTDTVKQDAANHRVLRWIDVNSWEMQVTCAILRIPLSIGLGWWGHAVCQLDPVILDDGSIGIGCDNSWGPTYGDNGYFLLTESRGTADLGAVGPIAQMFFNQ